MQTEIGDVAATSFITLNCHALETHSANPILSDMKAAEISGVLNKTLLSSQRELDRILISG